VTRPPIRRPKHRPSAPNIAPPAARGEVAQYLERVISDSYKREFDQEENVWRTLPFFATSIGLLVGLATLLHSALPPFSFDVLPLMLYSALILMAVSIIALMGFLLQAMRRRRIDIPSEETMLLEHARKLRNFYELSGTAADMIDRAVTADLRDLLVEQFARAAMSARRNNLARVAARGRAVYALGAALAFAFVLVGVILFRDAIKDSAGHDSQATNVGAAPEAGSPTRPDDGNHRQQATPPQDGAPSDRRLDAPPGTGPGAPAIQEGSDLTKEAQKPPASAPAPEVQRPTPPPMQSFLKTRDSQPPPPPSLKK
jgi:hypothetical protein